MPQKNQPARHEQTAQQADSRHYHQPVAPHDNNPAGAILSTGLVILLGFMLLIGLVEARQQLATASIVLAILLMIIAPVGAGVLLYLRLKHNHFLDDIKRQHASLDLTAKADQIKRENETHEVRMYLAQTRLNPDELGNRPHVFNPRTFEIVESRSGNFVQAVPGHYHIEQNYSDTSTRAAADPNTLAAIAGAIKIPTFAESLASGDIGPGQRDMLFSFELLQDEMSGKFTGQISPIRGTIGAQHTQFICAGSQSGKSTYMSHMVGQAAFMQTLFYIIDPHGDIPEKSFSQKVAAYKDFFIMPPATTHEQIRKTLDHMTRTRDLLLHNKSPYPGYRIMVIIDEVPALMAWQRSRDKGIKQLYIDLALFMASIGTQTAKVGITGLFASQLATKEELGEIEIRDVCMSQLVGKLHPVQAQAMRILGSEKVKTIPSLPPGHAYLMLSNNSSEAKRVAFGNVTQQDLTAAAALLPPSPLVKEVRRPARNTGHDLGNELDNELGNEPETSSPIPIREGVFTPSETSSNQVQTKFRNKFDPSIQAKLEELEIPDAYIRVKLKRVLGMLGQDKKIIMHEVWGVYPNKSKAYEEAEVEYTIVMQIISTLAMEREA